MKALMFVCFGLYLVLAATVIVGLVASAVAAPLAVRGNLLAALREE